MHIPFPSKDVPIFETRRGMSSISLSVFGDSFAEVFGPTLFILLPPAIRVFYQVGYRMRIFWFICAFHLLQDSTLAYIHFNNNNNNEKGKTNNWIISANVKGGLQDVGVNITRDIVDRCDDSKEDQAP